MDQTYGLNLRTMEIRLNNVTRGRSRRLVVSERVVKFQELQLGELVDDNE